MKARDKKIYGEVQKFLRDHLAKRAELGVPLHGEWEGCRRAHVCDDRYRVIWIEQAEIEDYEGGEGDTVVPVLVLRVGPKVLLGGGTIYQQPNPLGQ